MKKLHTKRLLKIAALVGCLAIVFSFTFMFALTDIKSGSGEEMTANAAIDTGKYKPLKASYDALAHGSTYTFTDKTKVDAYRADPTGNTDTTTIKVDRTVEHGEKENPYVINSVDGNSNGRGSWNAFVNDMASDANKGAGKYFVITQDLDWKPTRNGSSTQLTFNQVVTFKGNLFGLGHGLKNIVKDYGNNTSSVASVFGSTYGIIADLQVEYKWTSSHAGSGIANASWGSFLNCHAKGSIANTTSIAAAASFGGIVRRAWGGVYAYRCSASYTASHNVNHINGSVYGGIVADSDGGFTVYDCLANMSVNLVNPSSDVYTGAIVGIPYLTNTASNFYNHKFENIYATMSFGDLNNIMNGSGKTSGGQIASLLSGWHSSVNTDNSLDYKNIYVDGKVIRGTTTMLAPLSAHINTQDYTNIHATANNIHYVSGYSAYDNKHNNILNNRISTAGATAYTNAAALATSAADVSSPLKIWDKSKIGGVYSVTDNPLINKTIRTDGFTAKFYNIKNGNNESLGVSDIVDYSTATTFPTPPTSETNHKFVGWTMNTEEDEHIYDKDSKFASDIYGDVEFLAVWDVDTMTDDTFAVDTSSVEYLLGTITMTATVSVSDMTPSTVTYAWKKDTAAIGDTSNTKTVENVKESGTYSIDYCIRSDQEPLWRHRGSHSQTVTITPGKLTPQSLSIDKTAYYGMELKSLTPTVVMHNSKGEEVSGTASWYRNIGTVTDKTGDANYRAGYDYAEFYFTPDSSYNGNYEGGNTVVYNDAGAANILYFLAEYVQFKFDMKDIPAVVGFDFTPYNGSISYNRIANEFDKLYAAYYADNKDLLDGMGIGGYTPQLKHQDGKFYSINDYRTKGGGYSNVTATTTVEVKFIRLTYSVTYKYADEAGTADKTENGKLYGQQILKPYPNPTNGALMFMGWYYPATDINGDPILETGGAQKLNKWDFDVDCLFGNLVLTARWLKAESLDRIEITANKPQYTALTSIGPGDLAVTAVYIAKDENGDPFEMPVPLDFDEYKNNIVYEGNLPGDNMLHASDDGWPTQISVSFSYFNDGTDYSDTQTIGLNVNPRKIDISDLVIEDKYFIYDGNAHSLSTLSLPAVQHLADPDSRHINGIDYTYYSGRTVVQPEDIIEIGDYTVIISFTTNDSDYAVDPVNAMLYIVSELPPGVEPDNPTPVPGDEGGSNIKDFFEKLIASHFPLWQVAVMAVSAILALIFIIKAAQYGSRAKKAKGEAKKLNAKTYAALLPVFASDIVALGLSNKIWSIMAFAFAGFALLMLAVALITRRSWKKAELAKENALDEREQRKYNADREEREAEKKERKEFQEMLAMNNANNGQGADNSYFEQRLLEMEERHREELARRDEEQAKRDETMKIMLANLMGRSAGDDTFAYASMDDTDMLVQRVIAGLLPAMQQMMPEATAYLAAPQEQNGELLALVEEQRAIAEEQRAIVEEQNEEIRNMSAQMNEMQEQQLAKIEALQEQIAAMSQERVDGVLIPDGSDEKMAEMADAMREQLAKIEELQAQLAAMEQERVDGVLLPDQSDGMKEMLAKMEELQAQLAAGSQEDGEGIVIPDQSEEIKALTEQIAAMREQLADRPQTITNTVYVERETDEEDTDDEEEWDSILDEEDDFIEATIVDADGTVRKTTPNFRMRLKESSEKNREWYAAIKNLFCSQKGITYRVYKRVEKIRYQGQVIAVIGIAKRSLKLWLALKPYEYDARRYHHRDVSDKPRFVDVPLYVRVGSDRALTRAEELILALFQEQSMEARKRYTDRDIQELIFTLKHNRLLANKDCKQLLCEVMHVHDCDILSNEVAEKCIETKNVDFIDESVIETVKLDDIDANFLDGNRVTLDKLKKVGLVSEQCTGYTVAAGQRLTKPLIIVANDFTLEAVKMIALTGGRVIRLTKV